MYAQVEKPKDTKSGTIQRQPVTQFYNGLPRNDLINWVNSHLARNSNLLQAVNTLSQHTMQSARTYETTWLAQDTEAAYDRHQGLAGTQADGDLNTLRNKYEVVDLSQSKYVIKSVNEVNLDDDVEEDDGIVVNQEDDEMMVQEQGLEGDNVEQLPSGVMVSSPLYAGIQNFPNRYLNGLDDNAKSHYSFIVAYNAHNLLKVDQPVEAAIGRNELQGTRGIKIGFYWDQQLKLKSDKSIIWTDTGSFLNDFNQAATSPDERRAFVGSLKHEKVLKTFPYGMWRNIALNTTSVSTIMNSDWGTGHAPIYTHITDPDASTWVDPFSGNHVSQQLAEEAEQVDGGADLALGSYVYDGTQNQNDSDLEQAVKVIAQASSEMDALMRPISHDKQGLNYPAERNFMLKLKNANNIGNLFVKSDFIKQSNMGLTVDQAVTFKGKTKDNKNALFGIGDAEGRKLQRAVTSILGNVNTVVSSASVTTDVPGRVKASIVGTNFRNKNSSKDNRDMKPLSDVKESLVANSTTEMMVRTSAKNSDDKNDAIRLFRDRPRALWSAIADAHEKNNRSTNDIVNAIEDAVDQWQTVEEDTKTITALKRVPGLLEGDVIDQSLDLRDAQALHYKYYGYTLQNANYRKQDYKEAADWILVHITLITRQQQTRIAFIQPYLKTLQDADARKNGKDAGVTQAVQALRTIVAVYSNGTMVLQGLQDLEQQLRNKAQ